MMTIRVRVDLSVITSAPAAKNHALSQHTENRLRLSTTFGKRHMPTFARQSNLSPWCWHSFCLLLVLLLVAGCAARPALPLPPEPVPGAGHVIFVTSNGWHSSIVIESAHPLTTDIKIGNVNFALLTSAYHTEPVMIVR